MLALGKGLPHGRQDAAARRAGAAGPGGPCPPLVPGGRTGTPAVSDGVHGLPARFDAPSGPGGPAFARDNGDIICHHIEGVPWAEALAGQPFGKDLLQEWQGKKEANPKKGRVYLAISPGRGTLKAAEKSLPFPKELAGKTYDDPLVKKAYLNYCRRMLGIFKPDYLAIGIEVNEIYL